MYHISKVEGVAWTKCPGTGVEPGGRMNLLASPEFREFAERLAQGIVAVVGPHCEVVVHDLRTPEHSAIVVAGNLTGRKAGAPVPDLSFISGELNRETPDQLNYRIKIGDRDLQSSTIWIRDPHGMPIGAVCVNVDYSALLAARDLLNRMTESTRSVSDLVVSDSLARDLDDLIVLSAHGFLEERGLRSFDQLSYRDKIDLIETFERRGLFRIRGSAQRVADLLNVSRASIYNYRAQAKTVAASASVISEID